MMCHLNNGVLRADDVQYIVFLTYLMIYNKSYSHTDLDLIIKNQKKCVRVITFSHYLEPTESLFKVLKIIAKKMVIQRILLLMFKHNIGIVPKPIASSFTKKREIHGYNTRHYSSIHPAIGKSEATYKTFSYHTILI